MPAFAKIAVHITRILVPSSSQPGHCDGIEEASRFVVKSMTSQQLLFNYDLSLEWPKPSSAASPHTPQPAVLFVDSEFASVSTYNVQGPCGADQTTIPLPPVTPSGASQLYKHQSPYIKHKQNSQRPYSYCPDTPLYRFSSSVTTVTRLQAGQPKNREVRISITSRHALGPIQPHIHSVPGFTG